MLAEARADLASDLAGLPCPVYPSWPDVAQPPYVWLVPASPYVNTADVTHGGFWRVSFDVVCAVPRTNADKSIAALDSLLDDVLAELDHSTWALQAVGAPGIDVLHGAEVLVASVTVYSTARK